MLEPALTCFENLVSDGEACPVGLIVGNKLYEELAPGGDDRSRRYFPTKLPQHGRKLIAPVVDFHVVVPAGEGRNGLSLCTEAGFKMSLSFM